MTTDAQSALAQVCEALANRPSAGPWVATLRDPGTFQVATVDNFGVYSRHPDHGGNAAGFPEHDAAYIAACSPANIATILAHVEAQEAEIERLTAALQYEQHRAGRQGTHGEGCADWGPEHYECAIRERDDLKHDIAEYIKITSAQAQEIERLTAERDELRRQFDPMGGKLASADELIAALRAEKEEDEAMKRDARRYRWLRNEANTARKCDPMVCIYPLLDEQDLIDGDRLDVAIDAAMGLTRPAGGS